MQVVNTKIMSLLITCTTVMSAVSIHAQTTTPTTTSPALGSLSDDPWVSVRAAALGGAISPLADGIDAVYYNPAFIGGNNLQNDTKKLRLVTFPWVGASVNKNAMDLHSDLQKTGSSDPALTTAVLNAHKGERQYGRYSVVPAFAYSRFFLGYTYDNQLETSPDGVNTDMIYTHYRTTSGPVLGFSAPDPSNNFYMGVTLSQLTRKEILTDLTFDQINSTSKRNAALKSNSHNYAATVINSGLTFIPTQKANTKIALVAHNLGQTMYESSDKKEKRIVEDAEVSLGISISPQLQRSGYLNMCVEADNLTDKHNTFKDSLRAGVEYSLGSGYGIYSLLAIQAGYNGAGPSAGVNIHLGILSIEAAASSVNVTADGKTTSEQRYSAIFEANIVN